MRTLCVWLGRPRSALNTQSWLSSMAELRIKRVCGFESRIGGGCLNNVHLTERSGDALQKRLRGFDSRSVLSADKPGRSAVRASRVGYPDREETVKADRQDPA
mgnify:CR=1 FL=1